VCGHKREFTRYIDAETGSYLADDVGRCNREVNCGYHRTPKMHYGVGRPADYLVKVRYEQRSKADTKPVTFIPIELFQKSLAAYSQNNFVRWLYSLFGIGLTEYLIARYHIGTSRRWEGATVFWQVDREGRVRTGKVMLYDPMTGRRLKNPDHIDWVHSILSRQGTISGFALEQCLFGEHLLNQEPDKPVGVVESEKTAIIASAFLPDLVWLACGSLTNLTVERCRSLKGRKVILYPDLACLNKWQPKAAQIRRELGIRIGVSDLLETRATEADRQCGYDLADYLIRQEDESGWAMAEGGYPYFWDSPYPEYFGDRDIVLEA